MKSNRSFRVHRRDVLKGVAVAALFSQFGREAKAKEPSISPQRVPALQTFTDETSAIVAVLGRAGWKFEVRHRSGSCRVESTPHPLKDSDRVLYHLAVGGLSCGEFSELVISDENDRVLDMRKLKGLDLQQPEPRLAVMSCSNYRNISVQDSIWARVHELQTDLILFTGDVVYANSWLSGVRRSPEPPKDALKRFIKTWDIVKLYTLDPLVPVLTIWDDHDYGANNGDETNPYKHEMAELFRTFFPLPERHRALDRGPGLIAHRLTAFGIDFYMMDGRSFFRFGTHQWGLDQEAWFERGYLESDRPAWILSGMQFFRYFPLSGSLQRHAPETLDRLQRFLRENPKPTVLVSGDVHSSQVQKLGPEKFGFETFEITSSAVHSTSSGPLMKRSPEKGQIFFCGKPNFLELRPVVKPARMEIQIVCATSESVTGLAQPLTIQV